MRVSMIPLRAGGRLLSIAGRKRLLGVLSTKRFMGGDTWYKVLEFQENCGMPGEHQLYDPRLKECVSERTVMVFSGLAQENGAWVVQEWEVDVAPPQTSEPFANSWVNPARRYDRQDLAASARPRDYVDGPALKYSTGASRSND